MNYYLIAAAILVVVILGVVFYQHFKKATPINSAVSLAAIGSSLKTHLESLVAASTLASATR